ncbi:hypothetical protein C355_02034 [Cryptococcus neoformans Th84]|nr:hypothetical protein C355_02034 [Cryptococcus neoformans var. grubii Th84]OXH35614.1 hypothetical protein J009_01926 [Cryptococcus neoformans var. grubii]OXH56088.1 hypothetical protein J003_01907 [Cryptococcus neoformans var. grubii]OXH60505.1 hypothetical protein J002_01874 [Cryptococcus neoformans var. grubii]OXH72668.1 hypothetical protein J000_01915 [Cryptococcus neoformans var. grubii]
MGRTYPRPGQPHTSSSPLSMSPQYEKLPTSTHTATSSSSLPVLATPPSFHFDSLSLIDRALTGNLVHPLDPLRQHSKVKAALPALPFPSLRKSHEFLPSITTQALEHYHFPSNYTPAATSQRISKNLISQAHSPLVSPGALFLSPEVGRPKKKTKMDMNMAQTGSLAALPGIQTPLASYVAQMVVWLWYGQFQQQHPLSPISPSNSSIPDPFDPACQPQRISQLMVQPSAVFSEFVARLLQVTMVSHSVTLVAILYVYRLKMRNMFYSTPGSENRPFVAALMLANKYLDDNTYTNATWSELAGIPLTEISRMETEFLVGLNYELGVEVNEYERWKMLLDEFMLSRGPGSAVPATRHKWISGQTPFSPNLVCTPTFSYNTRARSASPPRRLRPDYAAVPGSRKRSAADAFFPDSIPPPLHDNYVALPPPSQPYSQGPSLPSLRSRPALVAQISNSSLARSASLNRQLAHLPSHSGGRRGSTGHVYPAPTPKEPTLQYQQPSPSTYGQLVQVAMQTGWDSSRALLAPYDDNLAQPHLVPPEHLMFYSLAAEPQTGAAGQSRKAILRYQAPTAEHSFNYPSHPSYPPYNPQTSHTPYSYQVPPPPDLSPQDVAMFDNHLHPPTSYYPAGHANVHPETQGIYTPDPYTAAPGWPSIQVGPQPAQFANAGPPGYAYNPYVPTTARWEGFTPAAHREMIYPGWTRTPDGVLYYHSEPQVEGPPVWTSRSEWSSPVSRFHM